MRRSQKWTAAVDLQPTLPKSDRLLVKRLNLLLCAGQLTAATRSLMVNALNATPLTAASTASARLDRVCAAVFMVMASAEYLIQK